MKTSIVSKMILGLLFILLTATNLDLKAWDQQEFQKVEKRNYVFFNKLYRVISEEHSEDLNTNLIVSPLSLEIVLAVAGLGAEANTKKDISQGIGLPLIASTLTRRYAPVLTGINDINGCILRIATQISVEKSYPIKEEFMKASAEEFGCGTQSVDFVADPEKAISTINYWAEQKTKGFIKNLLDRTAITSSTRLILTSSIYFRGTWVRMFPSTFTRKKNFKLSDGNTIQVDMMQIFHTFRFGLPIGLDAEVLELPYQGGQLSMVILLPRRKSTISKLESQVSSADFDMDAMISKETSKVEIEVSLPKFKFELKLDLDAALKKLGMSEMFTDRADFSGITNSSTGLKVSKVVQKTYIEVTEDGAEEAPATSISFVDRGPIPISPKFIANHPFLFVLWHRNSGNILFVGRVSSPESM